MASLAERIAADLVRAMKAGEKGRVETLRGLQSDLKYRRIETGQDLSESEIESVLKRAAKKRREAHELYLQGGREDLATKEEAELELISAYLPAELSDEELDCRIREVLEEAGAPDPAQVGKLMSVLMPRLKGQADGNRVRKRVQELLQSP